MTKNIVMPWAKTVSIILLVVLGYLETKMGFVWDDRFTKQDSIAMEISLHKQIDRLEYLINRLEGLHLNGNEDE